MREVAALLRASWLNESSYRLNMVFSLVSLVVMVVPLYLVASALQPVMASTISSQSGQYFAFALLGTTIYTLIAGCTSALPTALASAIGRGTFESFLGTPARIASLFAGMSAYSILWGFLRALIMLVMGIALGARLHWSGAPALLLIVSLLVLAYGAFGLLASAMLICFRTTGPLLNAVLTASALLGGVYYPTHVIPSRLQGLAIVVPLTYGLRAARQAALLGRPFSTFASDLTILALYALSLLAIGALALAFALRFARRSGTLGQY